MKQLCLPLLLACACAAHAQEAAPDKQGAYLSTEFGNGRIYGGNASGNRTMRWRAGEIRIGRDMSPSARIDFVYYNEGHPDNNHRDGFSLQWTYARRISNALTAELSAGPYSSYNTTVLNGTEVNDASRGILYSAALRYRIGRWVPGAHLRLGLNHVSMRDTHKSNAVMLGVGRDFTDPPAYPDDDVGGERVWIAASYGTSQTTQSGRPSARSATLEAKQYEGKWAGSVKAVLEGDDQVLVDRRGVAAQLWFVQPITERWQVSAGAGPYVARNRRTDSTGIHALITMQFERNMGERNKAFFAFSRVKSFQEANDRDLFHLGLTHAFGK
jgi:hypothetical protein